MSSELVQQARLLAIRKHLCVRPGIDQPNFENEVLATSISRIDSFLGEESFESGEDLIVHLSDSLGIHFEEIHSQGDIDIVKDKYLSQQELGFGHLPREFANPNVDAVMFKRTNIGPNDSNRYVAVLNLQDNDYRAYYSKCHEIGHRIAEPPQQELSFRHRADTKNRVESIVDQIAAHIAFHPRFFGPVVDANSMRPLTWGCVEDVRNIYAPSASREATIFAVINRWPRAAFYLNASLRTKKNKMTDAPALRISVRSYNKLARKSNLRFFSNMRVPKESLAYRSFELGIPISGVENLSIWTTSSGSGLPSVEASVSSHTTQDGVSLLVSL